jgi:hypothetical protein
MPCAQLLGLQQKHHLIDPRLAAKSHEFLKPLPSVAMGVNEVAQNVTIVCSRLIKLLRHAETPCDNESGSPQQAFLGKWLH